MDACTGTIVNYSNTPIEMLETEQPLLVERYSSVEDSGGPGEYRGGLALERRLRFLYDEGTVQVRSDRRAVRPCGLRDGTAGAPSNVRIRRARGEVEQMPSKFLTPLVRDDVIELRLASGGGYGPAFARDPDRVLADVREEKVPVARAAQACGVVSPATHPGSTGRRPAPAAPRCRRQRRRPGSDPPPAGARSVAPLRPHSESGVPRLILEVGSRPGKAEARAPIAFSGPIVTPPPSESPRAKWPDPNRGRSG